jgi:hypothetical protein
MSLPTAADVSLLAAVMFTLGDQVADWVFADGWLMLVSAWPGL